MAADISSFVKVGGGCPIGGGSTTCARCEARFAFGDVPMLGAPTRCEGVTGGVASTGLPKLGSRTIAAAELDAPATMIDSYRRRLLGLLLLFTAERNTGRTG